MSIKSGVKMMAKREGKRVRRKTTWLEKKKIIKTMDGEGWASQLETNAQNGELESGVGWGGERTSKC